MVPSLPWQPGRARSGWVGTWLGEGQEMALDAVCWIQASHAALGYLRVSSCCHFLPPEVAAAPAEKQERLERQMAQQSAPALATHPAHSQTSDYRAP